MEVGRITFSNRFENALAVLKDEAINSRMWEEEFRKAEYRISELEELLCQLKKTKKSRKK
jgi:hypothetical protein